jgi:hypothetical protein
MKALRAERAALAEMVLIPMAEWAQREETQPSAEVFEFSGLSPPELSRSWQFFFRAALPVRAPSLFS